MGRDPSPRVRAWWVSQLHAGLSRSALTDRVSHSDFADDLVIRSAYARILGRAPTADWATTWFSRLRDGTQANELIVGLYGSAGALSAGRRDPGGDHRPPLSADPRSAAHRGPSRRRHPPARRGRAPHRPRRAPVAVGGGRGATGRRRLPEPARSAGIRHQSNDLDPAAPPRRRPDAAGRDRRERRVQHPRARSRRPPSTWPISRCPSAPPAWRTRPALQASGGTPPYTFSVVGLPVGLTPSGSTIAGTTFAGGTTFVSLTARDAVGRTRRRAGWRCRSSVRSSPASRCSVLTPAIWTPACSPRKGPTPTASPRRAIAHRRGGAGEPRQQPPDGRRSPDQPGGDVIGELCHVDVRVERPHPAGRGAPGPHRRRPGPGADGDEEHVLRGRLEVQPPHVRHRSGRGVLAVRPDRPEPHVPRRRLADAAAVAPVRPLPPRLPGAEGVAVDRGRAGLGRPPARGPRPSPPAGTPPVAPAGTWATSTPASRAGTTTWPPGSSPAPAERTTPHAPSPAPEPDAVVGTGTTPSPSTAPADPRHPGGLRSVGPSGGSEETEHGHRHDQAGHRAGHPSRRSGSAGGGRRPAARRPDRRRPRRRDRARRDVRRRPQHPIHPVLVHEGHRRRRRLAADRRRRRSTRTGPWPATSPSSARTARTS